MPTLWEQRGCLHLRVRRPACVRIGMRVFVCAYVRARGLVCVCVCVCVCVREREREREREGERVCVY